MITDIYLHLWLTILGLIAVLLVAIGVGIWLLL